MTQTNPSEAPIQRDPAADTDPLLHLHKMSTTAGLGTQEYVAINVTAVVAALFGVASMLALINDILLVIPIVGSVLSFVALAQIRNSNGTQTGKGLAVVGLLLSGGITVGLICTRVVEGIHRTQDQRAIAKLCDQFGALISQRKYDDAYALFDADFQGRFKPDPFKNRLASMQENKVTPPIDQVEWNGLIQFQADEGGSDSAETVMKLHFKGVPNEERASARFRKSEGGAWKINNIPDLFPPPATPAAAPQR
jgi:hypothetical protein